MVTSITTSQDLLPPDDAIGLLARLDGDAKIGFQLIWNPVRRGTFAIASAGVRDCSDGVLYDNRGLRCGWIDYTSGRGAVDVVALRHRKDWVIRYSYDPTLTVARRAP